MNYIKAKNCSASPSCWKAGFISQSESLLVPKDAGHDVASSWAVFDVYMCHAWNILEDYTGLEKGRMCPFDRAQSKKKRKNGRVISQSVSWKR